MTMRRTVRVARVRLKRGELGARSRDGLHLGQLQRAEVRVERVDRAPIRVFGDRGCNEFRGNFLPCAMGGKI